jgi:hypothetical protein
LKRVWWGGKRKSNRRGKYDKSALYAYMEMPHEQM